MDGVSNLNAGHRTFLSAQLPSRDARVWLRVLGGWKKLCVVLSRFGWTGD
jgi:hypothetical protein